MAYVQYRRTKVYSAEADVMNREQEYPNIMVSSQSESLDKVLSDFSFGSKVVLDAGTGAWSAGFLARRKPRRVVCVAGPGDKRKEEEARNRLESIGYKNYQIILENLVCENLFPTDTFDFILAHYLIEEIDGFAPLGICEVLQNLYKYLRVGGDLVIVSPEAYVPFRPEYELTSALGIQGDAQLGMRSSRDLVEALYILLFAPATLMLLSAPVGGRYPSKWICNWLIHTGFKELETYFFDIKVYVDEEFTKRSEFARQVVLTMCTPKLREGLLERLEEVVSEYRRRKVTKDDFFLQRHYITRAKKV
jgi:SAM-dependent methyltransferase